MITGSIGDAALGLALRRDHALAKRCGLDDDAVRYLDGRFSRPRAPVAMVAALRAHASAAMDVSDGLMKDVDRMCRASGAGGRIEAEAVPLSRAAAEVVAAGGATLQDLLSGGEDYEVVATVPPNASAAFERIAGEAVVRVSRIGIMTDGPPGAIAVGAAGEPLSFPKLGWDHFKA